MLPITGALVLLALLAAEIAVPFKSLPPVDSHTYAMLLAKRGVVEPIPDTLFATMIAKGDLGICRIQRLIADVFSLSEQQIGYLEMYHVLLRLAMLAALVLCATALPIGAFKWRFAFLILLVGMFVSSPITRYVYAYRIGGLAYFDFQLGTSINGLMLLSFVLWLIGRARWAFVCVFAIALFHPSNAVLLAAVFLAHEGALLLTRRVSVGAFSRTCLWAALAVAPVLPNVVGMLHRTEMLLDRQAFAALLAYSNPYHLFPWHMPERLTHFLAMTTMVAVFLNLPLVEGIGEDRLRRARSAFLAAFALCVANWILMEYLNVYSLGGDKILGRISILIDFLFGILSVYLIFESYHQRQYPLLAFLLFSYCSNLPNILNQLSAEILPAAWLAAGHLAGIVCIPPGGNAGETSSALRRVAGHLRAHWKSWAWTMSGIVAIFWTMPPLFTPRRAILLAVLAAAFCVLWLVSRRHSAVALVAVVFLVIGARVCRLSAEYPGVRERTITARSAAQWIKGNTEKSALFLTPFDFGPYIAESVIERNVIVTYNTWNLFSYYHEMLPQARKAMKAIYGMDIFECSRARDGFRYCPHTNADFDAVYMGLDADRVSQIQREYPELRYFIYPRSGAKEIAEIIERFSPFEMVYHDEWYVLFRLPRRVGVPSSGVGDLVQ